MRRLRLKIGLLAILFFMASCAWMQPAIDDPVSDGVRLTEWQVTLYNQYMALYEAADEETRERLREEVAPVIDETKYMIIRYNNAVLEGERPIYRAEYIRGRLRDAEEKLEGF